uniref:Putative secreted protein n=1 Tax=Ixodes ricinus TaxID=34613 RepID=A0A6B0U5K5_IXORI
MVSSRTEPSRWRWSSTLVLGFLNGSACRRKLMAHSGTTLRSRTACRALQPPPLHTTGSDRVLSLFSRSTQVPQVPLQR